MTTAIHELQYHLTTSTSKRVTEACLFQLLEKFSDIVMTSQLKSKFKIIMFMSFRLNDVEIRYFNIERECLIIVNVLTEVKWLIVNSKWKIIRYIDHHVLNLIMTKKSNEYKRIAIWQDKWNEYDIKIIHKLVIDSMIDITNELNKLSTKLITKYRIVNQQKSHFMKKDEDNEKNNENDSIEKTIRKKAEAITKTIMSKNWIKTTHEKHLKTEFEAKEWEKYDWCFFFQEYDRVFTSRIKRNWKIIATRTQNNYQSIFQVYLSIRKIAVDVSRERWS
jgi:hypothetical protein